MVNACFIDGMILVQVCTSGTSLRLLLLPYAQLQTDNTPCCCLTHPSLHQKPNLKIPLPFLFPEDNDFGKYSTGRFPDFLLDVRLPVFFRKQWLCWTSHNGDYSSGHCSGLAPDSLLCRGRWPQHHQSACKSTTIIPFIGLKSEKSFLFYSFVWFSTLNDAVAFCVTYASTRRHLVSPPLISTKSTKREKQIKAWANGFFRVTLHPYFLTFSSWNRHY